jgi:glycosyltransferase involved in cell wall biosynthesis
MGGYWPGHEATGPNQSLRHMCTALRGECQFSIVSRDRPFGATAPTAETGHWRECDIGHVHYLPVGAIGPVGLRDILSMPHDLLWMNGFHDREFTLPALIMRRLHLVQRTPAVLSARGELADGALGLKSPRKSAYRMFARHTQLLSDVFIHAASAGEAADIERWFPWSRGGLLAPNVRGLVGVDDGVRASRSLAPGSPLRIVLVGRISRVKNILFAIETMARITVPAQLDILGPIEDADYWRVCEREIARLPAHVSVKAVGTVTNAEIPAAIGSADLFFLPTLGENFGHAIFEAIACEVPVLISDRTPWKGLSDFYAGWEFPLGDHMPFAAQIDALYAMPPEERAKLRSGARAYAERFVAGSDAVAATRRLIETVTRGADRPFGMGAT